MATGEHAANRVIFKQLLQAEAIDYCQIDACRLGGVNEVLAVLLLAAKFGVPVCPHAGGLGLCEYVQHLSVDRLRRASAARSTTAPRSSPTTCTSTSCTRAIVRDGRYVAAVGRPATRSTCTRRPTPR